MTVYPWLLSDQMTKVDFAYAVVVLHIRMFRCQVGGVLVLRCDRRFFSCGSFLNDLKFSVLSVYH